MPKTKFQEVVFTAIMVVLMVYGMVVYNVAINTGEVCGETFALALHELPYMAAIAFVLEFFIVGKVAGKLTFTVMKPTDRPQFITYAFSICTVCIMCPVMSLIAMFLINDTQSFGAWIDLWVRNFPMAFCLQMFYCGPFVRLIFRLIFRQNKKPEEA